MIVRLRGPLTQKRLDWIEARDAAGKRTRLVFRPSEIASAAAVLRALPAWMIASLEFTVPNPRHAIDSAQLERLKREFPMLRVQIALPRSKRVRAAILQPAHLAHVLIRREGIRSYWLAHRSLVLTKSSYQDFRRIRDSLIRRSFFIHGFLRRSSIQVRSSLCAARHAARDRSRRLAHEAVFGAANAFFAAHGFWRRMTIRSYWISHAAFVCVRERARIFAQRVASGTTGFYFASQRRIKFSSARAFWSLMHGFYRMNVLVYWKFLWPLATAPAFFLKKKAPPIYWLLAFPFLKSKWFLGYQVRKRLLPMNAP